MDKHYKWLVLLAVYISILIMAMPSYAGGIIYYALLEKYGGNKAKTSLVLSLNWGLMCVLGPLSSAIIDRFGCRITSVAGGILLIVSGVLSFFAKSIDVLIFTYGIVGGVGSSLTVTPQTVILCYYFDKHRSLVVSFANAITGIGFFLGSPVVFSLLEAYAIDGTFLMMGAILAHVCLVGVICKPSKQEISAQLTKTRAGHTNVSSDEKSPSNCLRMTEKFVDQFCSKLSLKLLSNVPFAVFLMSTLTWNITLAVCIVHLPNSVLVSGGTGEEVTTFMTCLSISNTIGRFMAAFSVHIRSFNYLLSHTILLGIGGIINVIYPFYRNTRIFMYAFTVVLGFCTGGPNSYMTPISLELVGIEFISAAHGLEFFFCGVGVFVGPPVAGFIYGQTGSYGDCFIFSGIIMFTGCVLGLCTYFKYNKQLRGSLSETVTKDSSRCPQQADVLEEDRENIVMLNSTDVDVNV